MAIGSWGRPERSMESLGSNGDAASPCFVGSSPGHRAPAPVSRSRPDHTRQPVRQRRAWLGRILSAAGDGGDSQGARSKFVVSTATESTTNLFARIESRTRATPPLGQQFVSL